MSCCAREGTRNKDDRLKCHRTADREQDMELDIRVVSHSIGEIPEIRLLALNLDYYLMKPEP